MTTQDRKVFRSVAIVASDMTPGRRMAIIDATIQEALDEAREMQSLRNQNLIVRDLVASDMPDRTNNHWQDQVSATEDAYENLAYATSATSGNTLAADVVVGIYGVYLSSDQDAVSGMRISTGNRRVAQWDFNKALTPAPFGGQRREDRTLFALSGVIIQGGQPVTVQAYVRGATAQGVQPSEVVLLGVVVEKEGTNVNPGSAE